MESAAELHDQVPLMTLPGSAAAFSFARAACTGVWSQWLRTTQNTPRAC
jgi:hypothetical protein